MSFEEKLLTTPLEKWTTRQAIAFDWYDGPRGGICALSEPDAEFLFTLVAERPTEDTLDDRFFRLHEMPSGSVANVLELLKPLGTPVYEVWVPVWKFPTAEERRQVEGQLKQLEAEGKPTNIIIWSRDMKEFLGRWSLDPKIAAQADLSSMINFFAPQAP